MIAKVAYEQIHQKQSKGNIDLELWLCHRFLTSYQAQIWPNKNCSPTPNEFSSLWVYFLVMRQTKYEQCSFLTLR